MSAHPRHLLALIAEIQGILVGCFILSVILNRWYQRRRRRRAEPLQTALQQLGGLRDALLANPLGAHPEGRA